MTTPTTNCRITKPTIRAFKPDQNTWLRRSASVFGGAIYKIDLDKEHFTNDPAEAASSFKILKEKMRLFVGGDWKGGGVGGTVFHYVYFAGGEWYLFNSADVEYINANFIAVPYEITSEPYYSVAIFTHEATAQNTMIPECDKETARVHEGEKYKYVTYIDDECLNGCSELMLIATRVVDNLSIFPVPDAHHFAVWYDENSTYTKPGEPVSPKKGRWTIAYTSRHAIEEGTKFNVMAMVPWDYEMDGDEGWGWREYPASNSNYIKHAFAFTQEVKESDIPPTNKNTVFLKSEAVVIFDEIKTPGRSLPECYVEPVKSLEKRDLIVVSTELWDGPVYTEELLRIKFNIPITEPLPSDLQERVGKLRPHGDINMSTLSVWYVEPGFMWGGEPVVRTDLWALYTNSSEIKPIKLNICTRLPCPKWCGGTTDPGGGGEGG